MHAGVPDENFFNEVYGGIDRPGLDPGTGPV